MGLGKELVCRNHYHRYVGDATELSYGSHRTLKAKSHSSSSRAKESDGEATRKFLKARTHLAGEAAKSRCVGSYPFLKTRRLIFLWVLGSSQILGNALWPECGSENGTGMTCNRW